MFVRVCKYVPRRCVLCESSEETVDPFKCGDNRHCDLPKIASRLVLATDPLTVSHCCCPQHQGD